MMMDDSERSELRRLRRDMETSSLGDRPQSMSALKLQRLIDLETKEIQDYAAVRFHSSSSSYSVAQIEALAWVFVDGNDASGDQDAPDAIKLRMFMGAFLAWLAKREREGLG